jgi:hypothetical protein
MWFDSFEAVSGSMAVRHITNVTPAAPVAAGLKLSLGLRHTHPANSRIRRSRWLLDDAHLDLIASWSDAILVVSLCVLSDTWCGIE